MTRLFRFGYGTRQYEGSDFDRVGRYRDAPVLSGDGEVLLHDRNIGYVGSGSDCRKSERAEREEDD
jgi:hypothetical protein